MRKSPWLTACLALLASASVIAESKWVPITSSDITTFIPLPEVAEKDVGHFAQNGQYFLSISNLGSAQALYYRTVDGETGLLGNWQCKTASEIAENNNMLSLLVSAEQRPLGVEVSACMSGNSCDIPAFEEKQLTCSAFANSSLTPSPDTPSATLLTKANVSDVAVPQTLLTSQDSKLNSSAIPGEATSDGGQSSYSVTIALPVGRNGMQPQVSLSYNPQTGNGIAGVGWSLNAGGAISRCSANYAQDGQSYGVLLDNSKDRLCLNGQKLKVVSGTYGASGSKYRTELDGLAQVSQVGALSSTSSYFVVRLANGQTQYYGKTANSRLIPKGLTTVLNWQLSQQTDASGNTLDYVYDQTVSGESVLDHISYTGTQTSVGDRKVQFAYESRLDSRFSYLRGGKLVYSRRLKSISSVIAAEPVLVSYFLNYQPSAASKRSILQSLEMCAANDRTNCTSTTFDMLSQASTFKLQPLDFGNGMQYPNVDKISHILPRGDIDGNGSLDWPGVFTNAEGDKPVTNNLQFEPCYFDAYTKQHICVQPDFNLDGLTDQWKVESGKLVLYPTNGSKIVTSILMPTSSDFGRLASHIADARDYNGDGWVDIVVYEEQLNSPKLWLYTHSKQANAPYSASVRTLLYTFPTEKINNRIQLARSVQYMGDMTGDGKPDLLITDVGLYTLLHKPRPESLIVNNSTSTSNAFAVTPLDLDANKNDSITFSYFFDVNGDGLLDWIGWGGVTDTASGRPFVIRYNLGQGQFATPIISGGAQLPARTWYVYHTPQEPDIRHVPRYEEALKVYDINNDGKPELLVPGGRIYTGCAFLSSVVQNKLVQRFYCGDQLYGVTSNNNVKSNIPSALVDNSIYRWDALYFDTDIDGAVTVRRQPTELYGHAYQSAIVDAFGNGLPAMVFAHVKPDGVGTTFTGEATESFAGFETQYGVYINRNFGGGRGESYSDYQPTDYLSKVTDALGNTASWRYRPLSTGEVSAGQTTLYQTDHSEVASGYVHFASSMYVVKSFAQSNGQGGTTTVDYAYKGAMYHLQGRGFSGFNQIWMKDGARDKLSHSTFSQKFPFAGRLTSLEIMVKGQKVLEKTNNWAINPSHATAAPAEAGTSGSLASMGIKQVYLQQQSSWQYDLLAKRIGASSQRVNSIDQFGNESSVTAQVTDYIGTGSITYQIQTDTVFTPDASQWWLNKFSSQTTTAAVPVRSWGQDLAAYNQQTWQKRTVDNWDPTHRQPTKTTFTASDFGCNRVEVMAYNSYGLPTSQTLTGSNAESCATKTSRITTTNYTKNGLTVASDGYLPFTVSNSLGHSVTTQYNMALAKPTVITAPNAMVSRMSYDALGRLLSQSQTGQPTQNIRYAFASDGESVPTNQANVAKVLVRTTAAGQPTSERYLDSQGRELRVATQGFDGTMLYQDTHYDALGRIIKKSSPYRAGEAAIYTTVSGFDGLDRPSKRTIPNGYNGLTSNYSYAGATTTITVAGRTMQRTYGVTGLLYETVDAIGGKNRFAYSSLKQPLVIADANNNQILAQYNGFGFKTQVDDPNQGLTRFGYNSFGELVSQTDANGVSQTLSYDALGRVYKTVISGGAEPGTINYLWDTLKQGQITSESFNGAVRAYEYDTASRVRKVNITVDGVTRSIEHQFDSYYGRAKGLVYPNGLTLAFEYNAQGYIQQISNAASGYVYQQITEMDASLRINRAVLAHGLLDQHDAYNADGTMAYTEVKKGSLTLQSLHYTEYDQFLNLQREQDIVTQLDKSYQYDALNRLTQYSFSQPLLQASVGYRYDAVGNFLSKSDYSSTAADAYRYGGDTRCATESHAGPNAVCQLLKADNSVRNFSYDLVGNLVNGDGLSLTYNAMNKPVTINGRGANIRFQYGSDGMRVKQQRVAAGSTVNTYYVDKLFEADSDGSWRAYIGEVAIVASVKGQAAKLQFSLQDRLGSGATLVDEQGQVVSRRYFDPFGRTGNSANGSGLTDLATTLGNRRGFTDHEMLNEQQLIHMNGRVYDYNLGRFMSVDPLIQAPTNSQSLNPYSYIMNNPMAGTDPTGYCAAATGSHIKDCGDLKVEVKVDGKTVGSTVVKDVNVKNGADVSSAKSKGAAQIGQAIADVGSQKSIAKQQNGGGQGSRQESGNTSTSVTETFISNHVIHKTEMPGKDEHNPVEVNSDIPKELREALGKFGETELGQKVYSQFIKDGKFVTFIEVTKETAPNYGGVFRAFAEENEIVYTTDVAGYVASRKIRVAGDGLNTATLGSLISHEFGHTQTGLKAVGQSPIPVFTRKDQSREELRASSLFENNYRRHHGMPARRSYINENDVLNYEGGL